MGDEAESAPAPWANSLDRLTTSGSEVLACTTSWRPATGLTGRARKEGVATHTNKPTKPADDCRMPLHKGVVNIKRV